MSERLRPDQLSALQLLAARAEAAVSRGEAATYAARCAQLEAMVAHRLGPGDRIDLGTGEITRAAPAAAPTTHHGESNR